MVDTTLYFTALQSIYFLINITRTTSIQVVFFYSISSLKMYWHALKIYTFSSPTPALTPTQCFLSIPTQCNNYVTQELCTHPFPAGESCTSALYGESLATKSGSEVLNTALIITSTSMTYSNIAQPFRGKKIFEVLLIGSIETNQLGEKNSHS